MTNYRQKNGRLLFKSSRQRDDFSSIQKGKNEIVNNQLNNIKLLYEINGRNKNELTFSTIIPIPIHNYQNYLEIYQWRSQTDYPIISCRYNQFHLNRLSTNNRDCHILTILKQKQTEFRYIEVYVEPVVLLEHYQPLNFYNFIYALKEAIVGFERLLAVFGSFEISSKMITVNRDGKVKVWVFEDYDHNEKNCINLEKQKIEDEHYMVNRVKNIFSQLASQNHIFREFFSKIYLIQTFLHFLRYIEEFCIQKKIAASNRIFKKIQQSKQRSLSPRFKLKPSKRTPKFIGGIQYQTSKKNLNKKQSMMNAYQSNQKQLKFSSQTKETLPEQSELYKSSTLQTDSTKITGFFKIKSQNTMQCQKEKEYDEQNQNSLQQILNRLLLPDEQLTPTIKSKRQTNLTNLGRTVKDSYIF